MRILLLAMPDTASSLDRVMKFPNLGGVLARGAAEPLLRGLPGVPREDAPEQPGAVRRRAKPPLPLDAHALRRGRVNARTAPGSVPAARRARGAPLLGRPPAGRGPGSPASRIPSRTGAARPRRARG